MILVVWPVLHIYIKHSITFLHGYGLLAASGLLCAKNVEGHLQELQLQIRVYFETEGGKLNES